MTIHCTLFCVTLHCFQLIPMPSTGVLHEVLELRSSNMNILLELRCVHCRIEEDDSSSIRTAEWLGRDHLSEVLTLLGPMVTKAVTPTEQERAEIAAATSKKEPQKVEILEGKNVRVAAIFRKNECDTLKFVSKNDVGSKKRYLFSQKVVASVSLLPKSKIATQEQTMDVDKILHSTIGLEYRPNSDISKYFVKN